MNISQIRHFLELAESLNFTSAARASGVTQPTLTRSIQRLEEQLGGRLLYRDGKDTRLTALGMAVRDEFEAILRSEERIHGIARDSRDGHLDKLSIGIVSSIAPIRFARFVRRVLEQLPMAEVVLHPISRSSGIELVLAGTLDGCIIGEMPERNDKLDAIPLFPERLLLGCGAEHRFAQMDIVPPHELANETYIDRLNCEFRERVTKFLEARGSLPAARLRSEREDWLQEVVASGGRNLHASGAFPDCSQYARASGRGPGTVSRDYFRFGLGVGKFKSPAGFPPDARQGGLGSGIGKSHSNNPIESMHHGYW